MSAVLSEAAQTVDLNADYLASGLPAIFGDRQGNVAGLGRGNCRKRGGGCRLRGRLLARHEMPARKNQANEDRAQRRSINSANSVSENHTSRQCTIR